MEYHALVLHFWQTGTFWVAVAVVIFFAAVGRKLSSVMAETLDKRAETVRHALEEAARLKAEAEAMLLDAQAKQAQAIEDAKHILQMAHDEAARISAGFAADAAATAERRKQLALQRIAAAETSAIKDVRNAAIDIATAATAQILRDGLGADTEASMLDHAIKGVSAALRQTV